MITSRNFAKWDIYLPINLFFAWQFKFVTLFTNVAWLAHLLPLVSTFRNLWSTRPSFLLFRSELIKINPQISSAWGFWSDQAVEESPPRGMRPILLPDPPSLSTGVPEIFEQGGPQNVVRRAVVIGNGFPGSENQSIGLARALGLAENHLLYVSFRFSLNNNGFDSTFIAC